MGSLPPSPSDDDDAGLAGGMGTNETLRAGRASLPAPRPPAPGTRARPHTCEGTVALICLPGCAPPRAAGDPEALLRGLLLECLAPVSFLIQRPSHVPTNSCQSPGAAVIKGLTGARMGSRGGRPTGHSRRAPLELLERPHRGVDRIRRSPGASHQTPPPEGVWVRSVSRREEQPVPPCPSPLDPGPQPALSPPPGVEPLPAALPCLAPSSSVHRHSPCRSVCLSGGVFLTGHHSRVPPLCPVRRRLNH
ncbi:uncharacterized protein LOC111098457 [Canis lupus familiaris]|uniref:uncharacterized protein LOC111098457 n=1 Tax=Canis lupus familiaris TaxID=9615 RepID=UPI0018F75E58|nr:uncharacterized protein LOC111098457 [Canis lupus familiaris]